MNVGISAAFLLVAVCLRMWLLKLVGGSFTIEVKGNRRAKIFVFTSVMTKSALS